MKYLVHAPGLGHAQLQPPEAFGAAVWLAMQAPKVKNLALHQLSQLVLQPQAAHSDILVMSLDQSGKWQPRLWLAYAQMSAEHERDYVRNPSVPLPAQAWHSGDRLWLLHLIAHPQYDHALHQVLQDLFTQRSARSLSPDSHRNGQRIVTWRGTDCNHTQAQTYWQQRPILA